MVTAADVEQPKRKEPSKSAMAALFAALARAQKLAAALGKDSTNQNEGYRFVSSEQIIEEAKRCLNPEGLALIPRDLRLVLGKPGSSGVLEQVWELVHEGGGVKELLMQWPVEVRSDRPYERVYAAAQTSLLGYLLRALLQIPRIERGDDLNADEKNKRADAPPKDAAASAPPAQAPRAQDKPTPPPVRTAEPARADAAASAALIAQVTTEYDRLGVTVGERDATSRMLLGHEPRTMSDLRALVNALKQQRPQDEAGGPMVPSIEKLERIEQAWRALGIEDLVERDAVVEEILGHRTKPTTSARATVLADELERRAAARAQEAAHG